MSKPDFKYNLQVLEDIKKEVEVFYFKIRGDKKINSWNTKTLYVNNEKIYSEEEVAKLLLIGEWIPCEEPTEDGVKKENDKAEYTGGSVNYYKLRVDNPTTSTKPYEAECNDIIEALGMNYAEGNAFKAIWRKCAARKFGIKKKGYDSGLYDSEKVVFFGERMVQQSKQEETE